MINSDRPLILNRKLGDEFFPLKKTSQLDPLIAPISDQQQAALRYPDGGCQVRYVPAFTPGELESVGIDSMPQHTDCFHAGITQIYFSRSAGDERFRRLPIKGNTDRSQCA